MNSVNIIVVKDNIVEENYLLTGENIGAVVEKCFLDLCKTRLSNWDEYSSSDKDALLEEGYGTFDNGSICINWPATHSRKFVSCDNCNTVWGAEELEKAFPDIPDLLKRISPGEKVPEGECPDCGTLVHRIN